MQKFGDNGNEFWWNDDEGDLIYIGICILAFAGMICFMINVHIDMFGLFLTSCCSLFFGICAVKLIYLRIKKIPMLYMNEKGIELRGRFISWDWITEVTKKRVPKHYEIKEKYQIAIYYYVPGKKRKKKSGILPPQEEIQELKEYINAYWKYYKNQ